MWRCIIVTVKRWINFLTQEIRKKNKSYIISYRMQRQLIGYLGIVLPFVCILGGLFRDIEIQTSISSYYYTNMRDYFVGILLVLSVFLITYRGVEVIDTWLSSIAGIAAMGIAFFPCFTTKFVSYNSQKLMICNISAEWSDSIHSISALVFFVILAFMSIVVFTLSKKGVDETNQKKKRNKYYRVCGGIIVLSIISIILLRDQWGYIVFIGETFMLAAFGISWIIKGEGIPWLNDKN